MSVLLFLSGSIIGSFLYCISGSRDLLRRSRCDSCGHVLAPLDLIPILSFLFHKGRCRYCHEKISILYPLSETVTGILFVLIYHRFGVSLSFPEYLILTVLLLSVSFCDLKTMRVPDLCLFLGIISRFLFSLIRKEVLLPSLTKAFFTAFLLYLLSALLSEVYRKQMMGIGDIRLVFLLSLYCEGYADVTALLIASLCGLIAIVLCGQERIPFAPCLCFGYLLVYLYPG